MRILVVSALYPPPVIGGAEVAARDLTQWLLAQGHEMGLLTTATSPEDQLMGQMVDGVRTWRLWWPRAYPIAKFQQQPGWKKPLWHLQDHLDPRNAAMLGKVVDSFMPDFVNIHYLQGIGYNALAELARRDVPSMYVVNDLGLACVRMSMFKAGRQCQGQCRVCALSSRYKLDQVDKFRRIGFWSPSRATLQQLNEYFPVARFPNAAIVYPNTYARPSVAASASDHVRFVYVGRLHALKGVDVLLDALVPLASRFRFTLRIVGGGPAEAELRAKYGHHDWLSFAGHVSQTEVADNIASGDVLCVPSIWAEALGMVVVHALTLGVPVIGSNIGGIPELVRDGQNGMLAPPGDVEAWRRALEGVLTAPQILAGWRADAAAHTGDFSQDALGARVLAFMASIQAGQRYQTIGEA
jgi:glycosyltransferase involved in cell wall biosynthesis